MNQKIKYNLLSEELKIALNNEIESNLDKFVKLFCDYNSHTNLISKNDEKFLFEKHIFDSLAINLFLDKYDFGENIKLLDIGTGGGFPSLPISICKKTIDVTAIDSTNKKIEFIKKIQSELNIENITPICARIEEWDNSYKKSFDIAVSRAVSDLSVILEYAMPFIKKGGYFVAYKSKNVDFEIAGAKNALKTLGAKITEKIDYKLPLEGDFSRCLLVIKKEKETPFHFPRKNGLAKKSPL